MEYSLIGDLAEDHQKSYLKARAHEAESRAFLAENDVAQFSLALQDRLQADEGAALALNRAEVTATEARERASKIHAIAGTTPADFNHELHLQSLGVMERMEYEHAALSTWVDNPELAEDKPSLDDAMLRLHLLEAGIKVLREKVQKLKEEREEKEKRNPEKKTIRKPSKQAVAKEAAKKSAARKEMAEERAANEIEATKAAPIDRVAISRK